MSIIWRVSIIMCSMSLLVGTVTPKTVTDDIHAFIKSFVTHYDFRAEGRYTHEYHPFLLDQATKSLHELSDRLTSEGLEIAGRYLISGYEGEAFPSYYTNFEDAAINDEASAKQREGWSLQLHNRFGLMTGYLFTGANEIARSLPASCRAIIEHINPETIELFSQGRELFALHAFGETFSLLQDAQAHIEYLARKQDVDGILEYLIKFWRLLYTTEAATYDGCVAATQDALFSIKYAEYLRQSDVPVKKYYWGADITYPIEVSVKQQADATINAQQFVKKFTEQLTPVNDEKTIYIFCSFVDGVGKSTMLGNVKNWMKHNGHVDAYERVDNSSSQYAEVFAFNDKVFIGDLPAQVSHFTYKPDGQVYVDAETELDKDQLARLRLHVREEHSTVLKRYNNEFDVAEAIMKEKGPLAPELNDPSRPRDTFYRNLMLLKRVEENTWIPTCFEGHEYVFNYNRPHEVRMLRSLSGAASHGLKNIESEQMLFYDGVRFPIAYEMFLQDLTDKIKQHDIKKVVFVDFVSMYPRSCRENIRINYLMQQLALLRKKYDTKDSLYKYYVNASQIYGDLIVPSMRKKMFENFKLEVMTRYALYSLLRTHPSSELEGLSLTDLTTMIHDECTRAEQDEDTKVFIHELLQDKFERETRQLYRIFGLSKEFINIAQFSFEPLILFSEALRHYYTKVFEHPSVNALWSDLAGPVAFIPNKFIGPIFRPIPLEGGGQVFGIFECPPECRDIADLAPLLYQIRTAWYAACANLLYADGTRIKGERWHVPPFLIKPGRNGHVYLIQKDLEQCVAPNLRDPQIRLSLIDPNFFPFFGMQQLAWGTFDNKIYCLDWGQKTTDTGLFAYDIHQTHEQKVNDVRGFNVASRFNFMKPQDKVLSEYHKERGPEYVMPTSKFYKRLQHDGALDNIIERNRSLARKNEQFSYQLLEDGTSRQELLKLRQGLPQQRAAAVLVVRMLATIEMIAKDPNAEVVVRKGKRKDFVAALKLIEHITLPRYFKLVFDEPLFENYDNVDPIVGELDD